MSYSYDRRKTAHKYDQDFEKLVGAVDAFSEAAKKLPLGARLVKRLRERVETEPDQKGNRVFGLNQALDDVEKAFEGVEKAVKELEGSYDYAMQHFNKLKAR